MPNHKKQRAAFHYIRVRAQRVSGFPAKPPAGWLQIASLPSMRACGAVHLLAGLPANTCGPRGQAGTRGQARSPRRRWIISCYKVCELCAKV